MGRVSKYPDELRERAVRMVAEVRPQYPSQWAAITAVAGMFAPPPPPPPIAPPRRPLIPEVRFQ